MLLAVDDATQTCIQACPVTQVVKVLTDVEKSVSIHEISSSNEPLNIPTIPIRHDLNPSKILNNPLSYVYRRLPSIEGYSAKIYPPYFNVYLSQTTEYRVKLKARMDTWSISKAHGDLFRLADTMANAFVDMTNLLAAESRYDQWKEFRVSI